MFIQVYRACDEPRVRDLWLSIEWPINWSLSNIIIYTLRIIYVCSEEVNICVYCEICAAMKAARSDLYMCWIKQRYATDYL